MTTSHSFLSTMFAAATLALLPALAVATDPVSTDEAARVLATTGIVTVKNAGPYVERGTYRIQVSTTFGRPSLVLPDGTWLYRGRAIKDSDARGTLVVRFHDGRVSELALATPVVIAALQADPRKPLNGELFAAK